MLTRQDGHAAAKASLAHAHAALKSPGTFVLMTHGTPDMRLPLLQSCKWESHKVRVPQGLGCVRGGGLLPALTACRRKGGGVACRPADPMHRPCCTAAGRLHTPASGGAGRRAARCPVLATAPPPPPLPPQVHVFTPPGLEAVAAGSAGEGAWQLQEVDADQQHQASCAAYVYICKK